MSLYWYLQYFAALGLFALIRVWVMIFMKIQAIFTPKNRQKSIKKAIQNRIHLLIEFWTVFLLGFGLHVDTFPVPNLAPKPLKK